MTGTQGEKTGEESVTLKTGPDPSPATKSGESSLSEGAKPASVSGQVMDDRGYLMESASIRLEVVEDEAGFNILHVYETLTDAAGRFEIGGIEVFGNGLVYAWAKGHTPQKRYGLSLSPGEVHNDVAFTLAAGKYFVAGEVVSEEGGPLSRALIALRHHAYGEDNPGGGSTTAMANWSAVVSDDEGYFEIAVDREGLCDFTVTREGYGAGFFPMVSTGTENARFVLRGGGAISGKVLSSEDIPVQGVRVEAVGGAHYAGQAPIGDGWPAIQLATVSAFTDDNGSYLVEGLGEDYFYTVKIMRAVSDKTDSSVPLDGQSKVFRFIDRMLDEDSLAEKRNLRVKADETTTGVDFVLQPATRVYGRVTDTTSGLPIHNLGVSAVLSDAAGKRVGSLLAWSWTEPDGLYEFVLPLETGSRINVMGAYVHPGGTRDATAFDDETLLVALKPGVEKELNFTVDAPMSIPIRVVDENEMPLEDIQLYLHYDDGLRCAGLDALTDIDGRFTWFGLPPMRTYTVSAADVSREDDSRSPHMSGEITGQPRETVPEVVIVYPAKGGVEGICVDSESTPISNQYIAIRTVSQDGTKLGPVTTTTDGQGGFVALWAFPEGEYDRVSISVSDGETSGDVENIEVVRDSVTDLGVVALEAVSDASLENNQE
ncbi:carboxypeptidase-like regulatory domain-containing protein [Candidatus Hydrogenedentota bacterium]